MEREALAARPRKLRPADYRGIVEVRLARKHQAASACFEGWVSANAGSFMQRSKIPISVGYGFKSQLKRCALKTCGTRQTSAMVTRSPRQNDLLSRWRDKKPSRPAKPSAIQCAYQPPFTLASSSP